ncbi:BrnA antitoxin family protein [Mesorhizobium sp. A623]
MSNPARISRSSVIRTEAPTPPARSREQARAIAKKYLESLTDEEDAALTAAALSDPDNPPLDLAKARRVGRPRSEHTKRSVHLRLDRDVIEAFATGGRGWQTRMNAALRKAAGLK